MSESTPIQRKHPPDRPAGDLVVALPCPTGDEGVAEGAIVPVVQERAIVLGSEATRGKFQKTEGGFTGGVSMQPPAVAAIGEKVGSSDPLTDQRQKTPMSYKEAVKPNKASTCSEEDNWMEDDWDGSLIVSNVEAMKHGVTISESERGVSITFSEEERRRLTKKWHTTLIIKLMGSSLGYMHLKRRLQALWKLQGRMDLSCIGNGYLLATFYSKEDYYFALEGGPWVIQNHYLTVQTWKSNFNPWSEQIRKLAIWVRLPGLPVDYYDRKFFYTLGNMIGKAIKVDEMTLTKARTLYARMCVEVDLDAPLLPSYSVDGNALKIEYEGLHLICFHCGRFGHNLDTCPSKRKQEETAVKDHSATEGERGHAGEHSGRGEHTPEKFGEWMVARDSRKGKKGISFSEKAAQGQRAGQGQRRGEVADNVKPGTSRFGVLEVDEVEMAPVLDSVPSRVPLSDISNKETENRGSGGPMRRKSKKKKSEGMLSAEVTRGTTGGQVKPGHKARKGGQIPKGVTEWSLLREPTIVTLGQGQAPTQAQTTLAGGELGIFTKPLGEPSVTKEAEIEMDLGNARDRLAMVVCSPPKIPSSSASAFTADDQTASVASDPPDPGLESSLMKIEDVERLMGLEDAYLGVGLGAEMSKSAGSGHPC